MLRLVVTARPMEIGQRHQRRAGHGSAGPQHLFAVALAQEAGLAIRALDRDVVAAEGLGKLIAEKLLELRHAHFR